MEEYITSQHRYYTLDFYLKKRFGKKVFKVALNGNFSCPNKDGTKSSLGCLYCSSKGSGDFAGSPQDSLETQFEKVKNIIFHKWPNSLYIPYFQANSNTYGPIDKLKSLFTKAIHLDENVVCLSIATRPDCINEEIAFYLGKLNLEKPIWVELGLQTIHSKTMKEMNLCYKVDDFKYAVRLLRKYNIEIIVHIINGLPGETKEMMLETIKFINNEDIQGVKIHSLLVLKNTPLATIYQEHPFHILSLEEYVETTVNQLRLLRKDIVVHRINADASFNDLIEPKWPTKKMVVMNEIDKVMRNNNYFQGELWKK